MHSHFLLDLMEFSTNEIDITCNCVMFSMGYIKERFILNIL